MKILMSALLFVSLTLIQDAPKMFIIEESAFTIERTRSSDTGLWMWWAVKIKNPNANHFCNRPVVSVVARDARGELVGAYDKDMLAFISPGGVIAYGDNLVVTAVPAKIEVTAVKCQWEKVTTGSRAPLDLKLKGVKLAQYDDTIRVSGELTNPLKTEIGSVLGFVLFRDKTGRLLGADAIWIKNIPPGASKPFMDRLFFTGARPENFAGFEFIAFPTGIDDWNAVTRPQ